MTNNDPGQVSTSIKTYT